MGNYHFLLSFTYIELMDKTTYLNHLFHHHNQFCAIVFTRNCYFSVDAYKMKSLFFKK
jgi:hypothetical protein